MNKFSESPEFDIFQKYYTKMSSIKVEWLPLESKDDVESERLRQLAVKYFVAKKYNDSLNKYTESLRYATYKGKKYAMVLANRSATYFAMEKYKSCLIDIKLSLEADYPINLKPKLLIQKAKCFKKMDNLKEMFETIDECCKLMQDNMNLPKSSKDNYIKEMKSLLDFEIQPERVPLEKFILKSEVILEQNEMNPNVSASVKIRCNGKRETDYVAARDIQRGEVLFVDPAYSVGYMVDLEEKDCIGDFFCDYCLCEALNCIPCKICINFVYCSEDCLDKAWTEYHQWECDMFRSNMLAGDSCLPLRTLIKAAFSGEIFEIINNEKPKAITPYLQIYSLNLDLASFRSKCPELMVKSYMTAGCIVDFLKRTNFFTRLMPSLPPSESLSTLENYIGGLLLRHILQEYQRCLFLNVTALTDNQRGSKVSVRSSKRFYAFCPAVSGIKYSCESNTSIYFNRSTCIVKACKNIKAGNAIFRPGYDYTPMIPSIERKALLRRVNINCDCSACEAIENNVDMLNTSICIKCNRYTVYMVTPLLLGIMVCKNCRCFTSTEALESMIDSAVRRSVMNVGLSLFHITPELKLLVLKKLVSPFHELMYEIHRDLLCKYSKLGNFKAFKEALQNFKTCAENRNGRFNAFKYVSTDLTMICNAIFTYLQLTKFKLKKQEITEILEYFSAVLKEAKEIAEYTYPPLLQLFPPIEMFILRFRVAHVHLTDD